MPRCEGHTLVIPKAPVRNLLDAGEGHLAACMRTIRKVAPAAIKAFAANGITVLQANEGAGGQVVFHLHFHLMPRWDGRPLGPPASKMEAPEVLAANAERIRQALAG
jgi:histidine triad (HIT) family protein